MMMCWIGKVMFLNYEVPTDLTLRGTIHSKVNAATEKGQIANRREHTELC